VCVSVWSSLVECTDPLSRGSRSHVSTCLVSSHVNDRMMSLLSSITYYRPTCYYLPAYRCCIPCLPATRLPSVRPSVRPLGRSSLPPPPSCPLLAPCSAQMLLPRPAAGRPSMMPAPVAPCVLWKTSKATERAARERALRRSRKKRSLLLSLQQEGWIYASTRIRNCSSTPSVPLSTNISTLHTHVLISPQHIIHSAF
jgi:hypothetical protein